MLAPTCACLLALVPLQGGRGLSAPTATRQSPSPVPLANPSHSVGYQLVRLEGVVGADLTAMGVEDILARAMRTPGCVAVLVRINAANGDDGEGLRIGEAVARASRTIPVIGFVERCEGPALPVLFACSHAYAKQGDPATPLIAAAPSGGRKGDAGAVPASLAKLQQSLESIAGTDDFELALIRGLTDPTAQIHAWRDSTGRRRACIGQPPRDMPGVVSLGAPRGATQLTLGEAIAIGLVTPVDSLLDVGAAAGIHDWVQLPQADTVSIGGNLETAQVSAASGPKRAAERALRSLASAAALAGQLGELVRVAEASTDRAMSTPPIRMEFDGMKWIPTPASVGERRKEWLTASGQWELVLAACQGIDATCASAKAALDGLAGDEDASLRRGVEAVLIPLQAAAGHRAGLETSAQDRIKACRSQATEH